MLGVVQYVFLAVYILQYAPVGLCFYHVDIPNLKLELRFAWHDQIWYIPMYTCMVFVRGVIGREMRGFLKSHDHGHVGY